MFDWSSYLVFAQDLLENDFGSVSETRWRNIISRAYYAAFHLAWIYLKEKDELKDTSKKLHEEVIAYFLDNSDQDKVKLGCVIDTLRWERVKADYYDEFQGISRRKAELAIKDSQDVLQMLKEIK